MENTQTPKKPNRGLTMALIGIILVVIIIVIAVAMNRGAQPETANQQNQQNQQEGNQQVVVDENTPSAAVDTNSDDLTEVELADLSTAKVVVPGANPITSDNKVVTETGQIAQNDAPAMSENAPKQTGFLNKDELSESVFKMDVGNGAIAPNTFTTNAGAPTTFSVTGVDEYSHVIAFDDQSLSAVAILVGPNQTKAITFQAPETPGTYTFKCVSPGHSDKGEVGQMIVQ